LYESWQSFSIAKETVTITDGSVGGLGFTLLITSQRLKAAEATNHSNYKNEIVRPLADFPASIWGDRFTSFTLEKQLSYTMASAEATNHSNNNNEIVRPLADFPASIWGDRFTSFTLDKQVYEMHAEEIQMLKEEVRSMLMAPENTAIDKLNLIDTVERLGISYHFEKEIEQQLQEIFNSHANFKEYPECDLFTTALQFRVFRQHGFNISSDIFYRYLDANGKFKETLRNEIKGLLSLYEAAHVRTHQDNILEEALAFTITHLKPVAEQMTSSLAKQVNYALEQAYPKGISRIESRRYISFYEEDDSKNYSLLRLAKLDCNLLQMLYKQELSEILRWLKDLDISSKLPYSRKREVECYFWGVGVTFEPQYSFSRSIFAKTGILLTMVDDTYDAYGTLDELKAFTNAIERWDDKEADGLPDYMKALYVALLTFCKWLDKELTKRGMSYAYLKYREEWKEYARSSYTQSLWFLTREVPPFHDYLKNGLTTGTYPLLAVSIFVGMESGTKDVFDGLSNNLKVVAACSKIARLVNDVASHKTEKERSSTAIECYMNHYNVSEEEAMNKLEDITQEAWEDINEEFLKPAAMPREMVMVLLNLARMIDVAYKHREDGFTDPIKVLKPHIVAVLVDQIIV
ncbi:hypothetical protein ACH5RR_039535, partial [Cinchona calisaya]